MTSWVVGGMVLDGSCMRGADCWAGGSGVVEGSVVAVVMVRRVWFCGARRWRRN